ncbi:ATP-binding protein [Bacteroides heparinolyticus]|uniref:sensor histidine kinase n=1 Tax=Prevotella heparinolytica TaxID=28113 RepID=UPI00359F5E18
MRTFSCFLTVLLLLFAPRAAAQLADHYAQANRYYLDAKNDSALVCLSAALKQTDSIQYERKTEILLFRSRVLSTLTFFEPAMEDALQAYDISKRNKNEKFISLSLLSVGKVHYLMYNDSIAEGYMLRAKELAEKKRFRQELMIIDNALAQLYSVLERNEECLALAKHSLELAKQLEDTFYIVQNLTLFAAYYINLNRWTNPIIPEYQFKAKQYLDEAEQIASDQHTPLLILSIYANFVRYYRVEKNYREALQYVNRVIGMCEPTNYAMLIQMYDYLVGIYAHLGNENMTINSHQKFHQLMRQQSDYKLHQSLQEMRVKHDVQEKELEIARQQVEIKQTRFYQWLLVLSTLFALLLSGMFYYVSRLRRKRNKELYRINASKDKLFSIVSHDLKSPVAAQKMATEMMLENFEEMDKPQLLERIRSFHQATETQHELLRNLLDWARMQTGQIKYRPTRFSLTELAKEVADIYRLPAQNKGISIRLEATADCVTLADRSMIHTVLRNLINNAVKFSHRESQVAVSVTCDGELARVMVKDSGVGMPAGGEEKILVGTAGEKGSGLGLTICREMLERNNTRLEIRSTEGVGTEIGFGLGV